MKIKLASNCLSQSAKDIEYKELISILESQKVAFLSHETDKAVFSKLEKDFERVLASEVKYGLAEGEHVYEVHIID